LRDFQARLDYRAVPFLGAAPCRFSSAGVFAEAFFAAIPQALQIARGFCGMPHAPERVGAIQNPARAPAKKGSAKNQRRSPHILPVCCLLTKIRRRARAASRSPDLDV